MTPDNNNSENKKQKRKTEKTITRRRKIIRKLFERVPLVVTFAFSLH